MKTHREKTLANVDDKELMNYLYTHLDRATDRNAGALNNLLISTFPISEEDKQAKLTALQGYLIQQNEDLSSLRFALKTIHKRFLREKRRVHNMRVQFEKVRGERAPEVEDVEMPDLWNLGYDSSSTTKKGENEDA